MKRRAVLGGLAAMATAGCISNPASSDGGGESSVRLARLSVKNEDQNGDHTIHVIVKRGGEIVHWSSHELSAAGSMGSSRANLTCTWGDDTGQFEILARLDDATDWRSTVIGGDNADCYQASVEVDSKGALGVWFTGDCDLPESETCDLPTTTTTENNS